MHRLAVDRPQLLSPRRPRDDQLSACPSSIHSYAADTSGASERMAGRLPLERYVRTQGRRRARRAGRDGLRNDRVVFARADEDALSGERDRLLRNERHHRAEQDRAGQRIGRRQQHARGDVRAVRESDGDDLARIEPVVRRRRRNERDEILGSRMQVSGCRTRLRPGASKEPRGAVLEDGSARTEQTRVGREHLAELNEIVLVAAGAVEQQQRALVVALRREIAMNVGR